MSRKASLVFYISNGKVKGSIVAYEKSQKPFILTTRVKELSYSDSIDKDQLKIKVLRELDTLCSEIKKDDLSKPECKDIKLQDACILISSPWYVSQTNVIKINKEKPFTVTEELITQSIQDAAKPYMGSQQKEISIFEKKTTKVSLNGYTTTDPIGKQTSTLSMSVFLSFAETAFLADLQDTITRHIHVHEITVHSQSFASFFTIQKMWKDIPNYIVADITSELTDLFIVRNSGLSEAASYPYGKDVVIRELSTILNTTGEVCISLLHLYQDQKLDAPLVQKITDAVSQIKKNWLESFTKALGDMSIGASLPSKFFLFASHDVFWLFSNFIKGEEYQQFSFSEGKFEVYDVKATDVSEFCSFHPNAKKDLSLAIGAIFNNKLY